MLTLLHPRKTIPSAVPVSYKHQKIQRNPQESLTSLTSKLGIEEPDTKALMSASANFGLCRGTS